MIKLSLIIITSGSNKVILDLLESIQNQKFQYKHKIEIIIISSGKYLFSDKLIGNEIIIELKEFKGYSYSCNVGAANSSGEFLFFLNDDLYFFKNSIEILINFLSDSDNNKWLTSNIFGPTLLNCDGSYQLSMFNHYTSVFRRKIYSSLILKKSFQLVYLILMKKIFTLWGNAHFKPKILHCYDHLMGAAILINRNLFEKGPRWDESIFLTFEDQLLCYEYNKFFGAKVYLIPNLEIIHLGNHSIKNLTTTSAIFEQSWSYFHRKKRSS